MFALVFALAGCSREAENAPVPVACTDTPEDIVFALRAAPRDVRLPGGTLISECVTRANTDAELQNLGIVLTSAAEELEREEKALQLGYLVGAARRGAPGESMLQTELVRRLERSAAALPPSKAGALTLGLEAGEQSG